MNIHRDLVLISVVLLLSVPFAISNVLQPADADANVNGGGSSRAFLYLGAIEGKSFLVDNSTKVNWRDAKSLCSAAGFRLAEIRTSAQHTFLVQNLARSPHPWFWTGARDAQTEAQLLWDGSRTTVSRFVTNDFQPGHICTAATLYTAPGAIPNHYFYLQEISSLNHVLCETV